MVVTNPGSGLTLTHLYLELTLTGIRNLTPTTVVLQYEDSSSAWCTLLGFHGTSTLSGYVAGTYSGCAPGSYPASFSLGNGSAKTFHFRIGYPTVTPGLVFYGPQKVTGTLYTGSCSSSSTCTAVAPLSGSAAPSGSATMYLVPTAPVTTWLPDKPDTACDIDGAPDLRRWAADRSGADTHSQDNRVARCNRHGQLHTGRARRDNEHTVDPDRRCRLHATFALQHGHTASRDLHPHSHLLG